MRYLGIVVLAGLFALGIDIWVMLWGESDARFGLWPLAGGAPLPPGLLPLLGLIIGVTGMLLTQRVVPAVQARLLTLEARVLAARNAKAVAAAEAARLAANPGAANEPPPPASPASLSPSSEPEAPMAPQPLDRWLVGFGAVCGTASILVVLAVMNRQADAIPGAALLLCGVIAFIAALHAFERLKGGEAIEFNSYWGGLGGSLGGWRLSPATTTILLALIFLGATVTIAVGGGPGREDASAGNATAAPADAGGTKGGGGGTAGKVAAAH